jgi:protein-L-isoaspartate(D-aspartate) O-methyltransferase
MDRATELEVVRRAVAKHVLAEVQVANPRLEAAFAAVRREDFLGPGPWVIPRWLHGWVATPDDDPIHLYIDNVVQLIAERHLNNGQPSGHAKWIDSAGIEPGEHVVHVGIGTGYYTAILAHLVGPTGRVTAIEVDSGLAARAQTNLAASANVRVLQGDGATVPFDAADAIYVNAGVTRPADAWLDGLAEGGRLIVPLTSNKGFTSDDPPVPIERRGAFFRIERRAHEYVAQWITPVAIIPCASCRDPESETALSAAFEKGGWERVTRLYRHDEVPADRAWLSAPGWCLAYD